MKECVTMAWDYRQPVQICFSEGRIGELGELIARRKLGRGVIVSTKHFVANGVTQTITENCGSAIQGCFSDFSANPDVSDVDACATLLRREDADFVIALGGGSAIDTAKAASAIARRHESIREYHGTGRQITWPGIPIIAIPTTAGTGSEVTNVSVLSDRTIHRKAPIVADAFYPTLAIIDPELTYTVPAHVTACTGMDVLSQAIEGFWSKDHQPICDACAVHATRLALNYLPIAVRDPGNVLARRKMCEASVMAGLAFGLPKTTAPHACSFPLTEHYGIAHGEACGLTLDYFIEINADAQDGRIQEFSRLVGLKNASDLAATIRALKRQIGLRTNLADLQLDEQSIASLVQASHHPNLANNPVPITDDILETMYRTLAALPAVSAPCGVREVSCV